MKTLFATVILSILSALVSVFAVTELCAVKPGQWTGKPFHMLRDADDRETRQVVRQWVNQ